MTIQNGNERLLRKFEDEIVLGEGEAGTCDIHCNICGWSSPTPILPMDAEVWGMALKISGQSHAITHLIEHGQKEHEWNPGAPEDGCVTIEDVAESATHIPVEDMTDSTCPRCGSDEVDGGFVETGGGSAVQTLSCNACDECWKNVYDFSAVYLIDEGVDGLVIDIPRRG